MELLTRTIRTCRRFVAHNGWFTVAMVIALVSLELAGRHTSSDWHDMIVASLLAVIVAAVARRHYREPLPWLKPVVEMGRRIWEASKYALVEIGYDLRGDPRVRRGFPPILFAIAFALLSWTSLLVMAGDYLPQALRFFGSNVFYLGYLALMSAIWVAMVLGIAFSSYLTLGLLHDELSSLDGGQARVPSRASLGLGLVAAMLVGSRVFYLWEVMAACLVLALGLVVLSLLTGNPDVQFLWRPRGSVRTRSVSAGQCGAWLYLLGTLLIINLVLTSAGALIWTDPLPARTAMPLTVMLGTVLCWITLGLLATLFWQGLLERWRSPARRCRRILHVRGVGLADRHRVRRILPRGWRLQFEPDPPHSCAVQIEIVPESQSQAMEFDPAWPLKVSLGDLTNSAVRERLLRRSDIQVRRRFIGGLERIFKVAARRKFRHGHGFLLAPHLPLWYGLRRDEPEPEPGPHDSHMVLESIGPPYHRAIPRLSRHMAHRVFRALEIDIMFVEDGLPFRRFAKVIRRMFEFHDKHGSSRPIDERDFAGLTGTRVLIYDMQFDNYFESTVYPEPKFSALGRARVLLVFRDRSEHEELVEPPFDFSRSPAPLGSGRR